MTLFEELETLGELMATNLEEQGVEADASDGLTTLAGKILDIEGGSGTTIEKINTYMNAPDYTDKNYTVGDSITISGRLYTYGLLDGIGDIKLTGATIKVYHNNFLMGTTTTNSDGRFSDTFVFQNAGGLTIRTVFDGTTHFNSISDGRSSSHQILKKNIVLPSNISDTWQLTPTTLTYAIGSQYQGAPITLVVDNNEYNTAIVNNNGDVEFSIRTLPTGTHSVQLIVKTNDVYETAQSNTFNCSVGVDIYLNPSLKLTSSANILSYADNDTCILSAQLQDNDGQSIPISNREVIFELPSQNISGTSDFANENLEIDVPSSFDLSINIPANSITKIDGYNTSSEEWEMIVGSMQSTKAEIFRLIGSNGSILSYNESDPDFQHTTNITINKIRITGNNDITYELLADNYISILTNNNGIANYTYNSRGIGDVEIVAESGSLVSERYGIVDAWRYVANPTKQTGLSWSLPSSVSVSFKIKRTSASGNGGIFLNFVDSSHTYFIGNWASGLQNGLLIRNTGSSSNLVNQTCSNVVLNKEQLIEVTYDNGTWTYSLDDEVKTVSANYIPTSLSNIDINQGTMTDLIIKPL